MRMREVIATCLVLVLAMMPALVHAQPYPTTELPNGYYFYDIPVDTAGAHWHADIYKHFMAKRLRTDSIKPILDFDHYWSADSVIKGQEPGMGFLPSRQVAPCLYDLLVKGFNYFSNSSSYKSVVQRIRPTKRFNEPTYGIEGVQYFTGGSTYSFPSSHSSASWGMVLLMACVNPWKADTIVSRGIAFGQSRVIGGAHWQSDVDAGRALSTVRLARAMADSIFQAALDSAKTEVLAITGHEAYPRFEQLCESDDTLAMLTGSLPPPYDLSTPVGATDIVRHVQRHESCTPQIMSNARQQLSLSTDNVLLCFAQALGKNITRESHPATYRLVDMHLRMCHRVCELMRGRYSHPRPVDVFNFELPTGEDIDSLRSTSSYPSMHSAMGWAASLPMVTLCPNRYRYIMTRAMEYGNNRVSVGASWQSDIEMGRLAACIAYGYTLACEEYIECVRAAQAEFIASP